MIFNDRGSIVWLQLLPPIMLMALAAGCIILLDRLGRGDSPVITIASFLLGVAALWLLRIGLGQWHLED